MRAITCRTRANTGTGQCDTAMSVLLSERELSRHATVLVFTCQRCRCRISFEVDGYDVGFIEAVQS